jgi:hypothetical protein
LSFHYFTFNAIKFFVRDTNGGVTLFEQA